MLSVLARVYALVLAQQLLFLLLAFGVTRTLGVTIREVVLGFPSIVKLQVRSTLVKLGPVPGGSVDMVDWETQPVARRIAIRLGPWLMLLVIALVCLGPGQGLRSFAYAFPQLLLEPDLTPLVEKFLWLVEHAPLHVSFGIVLAKTTALSLLPFAIMPGGQVIQELRSKPAPAWWMAFSLLVAIVYIFGRLAWAFLHAV